jgi:hypothetical protein
MGNKVDGSGDMDFISFVNYANGNHSSSVFSKSEYRDEVQELLREWDAFSDITSIYVLPYDADEFPDGDGDRAGEFFSLSQRR